MTPRWHFARRRAIGLLKECGIQDAPVPVEHLASAVGAVIKREPLEGDMSGMVYRLDANSAVIGVNSNHSMVRQRFTVAHELGHLLLHDSDALHFDDKFVIGFRNGVSSLAVDPKEVEANQFAAELLMPGSLIRRDLELLGTFDVEGDADSVIGDLAGKYQVSAAAMAIRLSRYLTVQR